MKNMKQILLTAFMALLSFQCLNGQEKQSISGRITDENGNGIEYVYVCSPGDTIFTISDAEGYYSFILPAKETREIVFSHIACEPFSLYPSDIRTAKNLDVTLRYNELPAAVVVPGKGRDVTVLGKGVRWAGCSFGLSNSLGGIINEEWGSKVNIRKPTRITKAEIECFLEKADRAVLSFIILKIERDSTTYHSVQHIPVYQSIEKGEKMKNLVFEEPEVLLLEPGSYYLAIRFVEFEGDGSLMCKGYFKNAYERSGNIKAPLSIGLKVSGIEYKKE